MWQCPTCNRKFKKQNQQHYCGNKPGTVDLQVKKSISDYTRERKLLYTFQKNSMNMAINITKDLFKSHMMIICHVN